MVLGVHILDLCHDLLGEPAWCFARASERGQAVTPGEFRAGAEGIGPLAGDRIDAMFGFRATPVIAHFATCRPAEPGRRFGLTIGGSKGCIRIGTGWTPPAFLLRDPTWSAARATGWSPIIGPNEGKVAPESNDLAAGNRAIVADLIRAVETDTQPRAHGARGADGRRDGPGLLCLECAAKLESRCRWPTATPTRCSGRPPRTVRPRVPRRRDPTVSPARAPPSARRGNGGRPTPQPRHRRRPSRTWSRTGGPDRPAPRCWPDGPARRTGAPP